MYSKFCLLKTSLGDGTIVVVLLDEIGLAQQSKNMPLKVLHSLLDKKSLRVALVGLSNWVLDGIFFLIKLCSLLILTLFSFLILPASNMNRAVLCLRIYTIS